MLRHSILPAGCFRKWIPSEFPLTDVIRAVMVTQEILQLSEQTQVCGVVLIENMSDVGLAQARNVDQKLVKSVTSILQDAFPVRLKTLNFVNELTVFGILFALFKPFLKEKLVKRLTFHGYSLESLQKQFTVDCLPEELGGTMPSGDQLAADWKAKVKEHPEVFEEFDKYTIELTSAIAKTRTADATECLVGTYRKLNVN